MSAIQITATGTDACRYCTFPHDPGEVLCGFHLDWECACNLVEDMCGGSTPGSMVVAQMIEWGWTEEDIARYRERETV